MAHYFSKHGKLRVGVPEGVAQFFQGAFSTTDETFQGALEKHPWFNQKFFKVDNVKTVPGPQVSIGGITSEDKAKFTAQLSEKDAKIAELEAKLQAINSEQSQTATVPTETEDVTASTATKKEKVKKQ